MTLGNGILRDRFEALYIPEPNSGCWLWIGPEASGGYGQFNEGGRSHRAHRFSYEMDVGRIPDGLVIDHLCRNRACVNPAHLEPVTTQINLLRGVGPTAINAAKTHCNQGHELTAENTRCRFRDGDIRRECKTCQRQLNREYMLGYNRRRRAALNAAQGGK